MNLLFAADPAVKTEVDTGGFWMPGQFSTAASDIDWAYFVVLWISFLLMVPICAVVGYLVWKYRRKRPDQEAEPSPAHNTALELGWTIPTIPIVTVIFYVGVHGFVDARTMPKNAYEINVKAMKWNWTFEYPEGVITGELHVPVNKNVILTMRSDDVLHAMYIPVLRVKQDVVPGRFSKLWFNVTKPVEANLFCAEYCGDNHSGMITKFVAHEQADFDKWFVKEKDWHNWEKTLPDGTKRKYLPAEAGEKFYRERGCMGCHSIDGTTKTGPSFKGIFGSERDYTSKEGAGRIVADENYIRESIVDPNAKIRATFQPAMPSFKGQFRDDELMTIIEYLKTLK